MKMFFQPGLQSYCITAGYQSPPERVRESNIKNVHVYLEAT